MSVIPAVSMAMSVPVPMAMPTSAAAKAGASLIPSPSMPTTRPIPLQRLDDLGLRLRSHPPNLVHARLPAHFLGDQFRIPGQHQSADAHFAKACHRFSGFRPEGVCHGQHSQHSLPVRNQHRCPAFQFPVPDPVCGSTGCQAVFLQQAAVANEHLPTSHHPADPRPV